MALVLRQIMKCNKHSVAFFLLSLLMFGQGILGVLCEPTSAAAVILLSCVPTLENNTQ